jgi:hypothetical protein
MGDSIPAHAIFTYLKDEEHPFPKTFGYLSYVLSKWHPNFEGPTKLWQS